MQFQKLTKYKPTDSWSDPFDAIIKKSVKKMIQCVDSRDKLII